MTSTHVYYISNTYSFHIKIQVLVTMNNVKYTLNSFHIKIQVLVTMNNAKYTLNR